MTHIICLECINENDNSYVSFCLVVVGADKVFRAQIIDSKDLGHFYSLNIYFSY